MAQWFVRPKLNMPSEKLSSECLRSLPVDLGQYIQQRQTLMSSQTQRSSQFQYTLKSWKGNSQPREKCWKEIKIPNRIGLKSNDPIGNNGENQRAKN